MRFTTCAIGAIVIGLFAGGTPASATSIDLSTWSCAKFQSADKDDIGVILAWMDGYYRGEDDPPILQAATNEGRMLMTFDLDFADIRHYPPGSHAGIVVFRQRQRRCAHGPRRARQGFAGRPSSRQREGCRPSCRERHRPRWPRRQGRCRNRHTRSGRPRGCTCRSPQRSGACGDNNDRFGRRQGHSHRPRAFAYPAAGGSPYGGVQSARS